MKMSEPARTNSTPAARGQHMDRPAAIFKRRGRQHSITVNLQGNPPQQVAEKSSSSEHLAQQAIMRCNTCTPTRAQNDSWTRARAPAGSQKLQATRTIWACTPAAPASQANSATVSSWARCSSVRASSCKQHAHTRSGGKGNSSSARNTPDARYREPHGRPARQNTGGTGRHLHTAGSNGTRSGPAAHYRSVYSVIQCGQQHCQRHNRQHSRTHLRSTHGRSTAKRRANLRSKAGQCLHATA